VVYLTMGSKSRRGEPTCPQTSPPCSHRVCAKWLPCCVSWGLWRLPSVPDSLLKKWGEESSPTVFWGKNLDRAKLPT